MWMRSFVVGMAAMLAPAGAGAQEIAQVNEQVPIAAHDGWVVWSAKEGEKFRLVAWHEGVSRTLAVRGRSRPFDVDVGTDVRGHPVATFSRCSRFASITVYEARRDVGAACRIRVVDLSTGTERGARLPVAPGTSDTVPSMWRGRVAFARRDPRHHGNVDQVMLRSPSGPSRNVPPETGGRLAAVSGTTSREDPLDEGEDPGPRAAPTRANRAARQNVFAHFARCGR
jgi:hypothetical protein